MEDSQGTIKESKSKMVTNAAALGESLNTNFEKWNRPISILGSLNQIENWYIVY